jgi:pyruvate dehydrogenase E1 component beta subunit
MAADPSVILIGEDIGVYGGAFGITKGLKEKFMDRVIDMPMSEQAIVGLGTGSALYGKRPIIELMFMDFITLTFDQLMNHAGIFRYNSKGQYKVPMVIRTPCGAGRGYGATHSKSLFSTLMGIPGIKIVVPSDVSNVHGLLKSSINDENPVVFVEHKSLYVQTKEVENYKQEIPLGKARIAKHGKDLLIITFGKQVEDSVQVAEEFGEKVAVLDLMTLKPYDRSLITKQVKKIGKVLVVEENYSCCGVGSEIISFISEEIFESLKCKPQKISLIDIPIPTAKNLEYQMLPNKEKIKEKIQEMIR